MQNTNEMTELKEIVFIEEIVQQSKIAQRAAERLQETNNNFDQVDVWGSIQSILIAAGNVSKILWPHKKYKSRGEKLRKLLNIDETNLLSDRKFRNHFEHYDERIEVWFQNNPSAVYRDLAMNPSLYGFGFTSNNHRAYNSFDNTLIFRGESLDLGEVLKALEKIRLGCSNYVLV